MLSALAIVGLWLFTQGHEFTNFLLQGVLTAAYLPFIRHLRAAKGNPDSFVVWSAFCVAGFLQIFPALEERNLPSGVYAVRGFVMTVIVLRLMYLAHQRREKPR